eukprot:13232881-Alexandrium_andersonii.AAC.1
MDGTGGPALHYHARGPQGPDDYNPYKQEIENLPADRRTQADRFHAQAGHERLRPFQAHVATDVSPRWTSATTDSLSTGDGDGVHQPSPDLGDLTGTEHKVE